MKPPVVSTGRTTQTQGYRPDPAATADSTPSAEEEFKYSKAWGTTVPEAIHLLHMSPNPKESILRLSLGQAAERHSKSTPRHLTQHSGAEGLGNMLKGALFWYCMVG